MNKDVLVALIAKDVRELQTLTEGLDQMRDIPAPYLRLALEKSKSLTDNIEGLILYLDNCEKENEEMIRKESERLMEEVKRKAEEKIALQVAELKAAAEEEARMKEMEVIRKKEEAAARARIEEQTRLAKESAEKEEREKEESRIIELSKPESGESTLEENNKSKDEVSSEINKEESTSLNTESSGGNIVSDMGKNERTLTTVAESIKVSESLLDKLSKKEDNTIGTALNNHKITDLKNAITIVDRFRFQRELFGGDGEKMNRSISAFNEMDSMDEASEYIEKNFEWEEDNVAVSDFLQLLHRRYL